MYKQSIDMYEQIHSWATAEIRSRNIKGVESVFYVVRAMASTGQRANRQAFGQQVFSM
jgi:hypothetical protein